MTRPRVGFFFSNLNRAVGALLKTSKILPQIFESRFRTKVVRFRSGQQSSEALRNIRLPCIGPNGN